MRRGYFGSAALPRGGSCPLCRGCPQYLKGIGRAERLGSCRGRACAPAVAASLVPGGGAERGAEARLPFRFWNRGALRRAYGAMRSVGRGAFCGTECGDPSCRVVGARGSSWSGACSSPASGTGGSLYDRVAGLSGCGDFGFSARSLLCRFPTIRFATVHRPFGPTCTFVFQRI